MATYENVELGVKFDAPDRITVRKQLEYYSAANKTGSWFLDAWGAAAVIVENWVCVKYPNLMVQDLDKVEDRSITQIVLWVGARVTEHMVRLEIPDPKLSKPPSEQQSDSAEVESPPT